MTVVFLKEDWKKKDIFISDFQGSWGGGVDAPVAHPWLRAWNFTHLEGTVKTKGIANKDMILYCAV